MSKKKITQDSPAPTAVIEQPPVVQEPVEEKEPTTSERLFPDLFNPASEPAPVDEEKAEPEPAPAEPEAPTPDPGTEPPSAVPEPEPHKTVEDILDIAAFQGKKVRVKVDGEEMEVPAETLIKNFQLESHLTRKGQQLGEQKRALEELRKELLEKTNTDASAVEDAIDEGESPQVVKKLQEQLDATRKQLAEVSAVVSPILFQRNVDALDNQVKQTLGFDDFKTYVPKIQKFIREQMRDPEHPTPQEVAMFDTPQFYLSKYQEMKLRELSKPPAPPPLPPTTAPAAPAAPAPKLTKIVNVETGGGAIQDNSSESKAAQIQKALARAKSLGTTEAWADYWAIKTAS